MFRKVATTTVAGLWVGVLVGSLAAQKKPELIELEYDPYQGKAALSAFCEDPVVSESRQERIRRNIPVLQSAVRPEPRLVDPDVLYERRIAMHEDGLVANRQLPRMYDPDDDAHDVGANRKRALGAEPAAEPAGAGSKILLVALFLAACLGFYFTAHKKENRGAA